MHALRIRLLLAVALVALIGGCTQAGAPTVPSTPAASAAPAASFSEEDIGIGEALGQIRGHHFASLELYRAGDQQGALTHAGHPVVEIFPTLRPELDEHGVDSASLESALKEAADAIDDRAPAEVVQKLYEGAAALTASAESAVIGAAAATSAYRGSVIAALLVTAGREYEEAVADGALRELIEYQDAYAFVNEAKRLYAAIEPEVRAKAPAEADEITEAFATLARAQPGAQLPASPAPVDDVQQATALIGHELAEVVGAIELALRDPMEVVAAIGALLDKMVETYREDRTDEALEIAAEAYLENYEVIEAAVVANAPEINTELEPLLAAEMRQTMREGKPVAELEAKVARAKDLLVQALAKIPMDH